LTKPEPLAVIRQQLDRRRPSIPEHKHRTRKGICGECFAADADQAINATPKVGGLDRDQ
jgi:hypothetical protein